MINERELRRFYRGEVSKIWLERVYPLDIGRFARNERALFVDGLCYVIAGDVRKWGFDDFHNEDLMETVEGWISECRFHISRNGEYLGKSEDDLFRRLTLFYLDDEIGERSFMLYDWD